ncbi:MAG: Txe/YoeB family addiction module toxin [Dyadobacter sp.]
MFTDDAIEDLRYWKKSGQKNLLKKIEVLIQAISEDPLNGIGKPEPLKYTLSGKYSRRINQEHRIIYSLDGDTAYILSLKGHY